MVLTQLGIKIIFHRIWINLYHIQWPVKTKKSRIHHINGGYGCRNRNGILNVVIQHEFMGVRPQFHGIDFVFDLVFNPAINDILGKNIALEQKRMIGL